MICYPFADDIFHDIAKVAAFGKPICPSWGKRHFSMPINRIFTGALTPTAPDVCSISVIGDVLDTGAILLKLPGKTV